MPWFSVDESRVPPCETTPIRDRDRANQSTDQRTRVGHHRLRALGRDLLVVVPTIQVAAVLLPVLLHHIPTLIPSLSANTITKLTPAKPSFPHMVRARAKRFFPQRKGCFNSIKLPKNFQPSASRSTRWTAFSRVQSRDVGIDLAQAAKPPRSLNHLMDFPAPPTRPNYRTETQKPVADDHISISVSVEGHALPSSPMNRPVNHLGLRDARRTNSEAHLRLGQDGTRSPVAGRVTIVAFRYTDSGT